MKRYCVVYIVCGIHYRYRCYATSKRDAKRMCKEDLNLSYKDIDEVYEEE